MSSDRTVSVQATTTFDVGTLAVGDTLEVQTNSGSTYWIVRVRNSTRDTMWVDGVSITTNSQSVTKGRTSPPSSCCITRYILRGQPMLMRGIGVSKTSTVVSWRIL